AVGIVKNHRLSNAWRLGESCITMNDGAEYHVLEMAAHFTHHLVAESQSAVVHRHQDAFDYQSCVQPALYDLDRVQQLAETLESEELALNRHYDGVRGGECVHGDASERR